MPDPQVSARSPSHQKARRSYDRLSRWYDAFAGSEISFNQSGVDALNLQPCERVLEIGFGTGHSLIELAQRVGINGQVVGIDLSAGMAAAARRRLIHRPTSAPIMLNLGDATWLPLPSNYFDAVFMGFTLELFENREISAVLGECRRVLTPAGRIGVVALSRPEHPGRMVRIYDWFHRALPAWVDCRPIEVDSLLGQNQFTISQSQTRLMWGLPVAILTATNA